MIAPIVQECSEDCLIAQSDSLIDTGIWGTFLEMTIPFPVRPSACGRNKSGRRPFESLSPP